MSDLKHQTVEQLQQSKRDCESVISTLKSTLAGQQERLQWINEYIKDIEVELGHRVILKRPRGNL